MQHLEVSGAVRHIYIYVIRRLKVKDRNEQKLSTNAAHLISAFVKNTVGLSLSKP